MLKFRRAIAICILALLTCQTVMAGFGERFASVSDGEIESALLPSTTDHLANSHADHGKPGTVDLVDTNCCHAHGHCHVLGLVGQVSPVSMLYGRNFVSSYSYSYSFQYFDPLLRPPTSV